MLTVRFEKFPGTVVQAQAETPAMMLQILADLHQAFPDKKCGKCGSEDIVPTTFNGQSGTILKWTCNACTASLLMAKRSDGKTVFPSRQDKDKNVLPNKGWTIYERQAAAPSSDPYQTDAPPSDAPASSGEEIPFSWLLPLGLLLTSFSSLC